MARSKKVIAEEEQIKTIEESIENVDSQEVIEEAQEKELVNEQEAQNEEVEEKAVTAQSGEIPEKVMKLLSLFPKYEELYIDRRGGVFAKETQPNLRVGAILYKNPFYKNNK